MFMPKEWKAGVAESFSYDTFDPQSQKFAPEMKHVTEYQNVFKRGYDR